MMADQTPGPERWIEEHGDVLYRFALSMVRDPHVAEDLVQETLLAAWTSAERFRGQSSPRTWLSGILRHKAMDHFRRAFRQQERNQSIDDLESSLHELFDETGHWKIQLTKLPADPHRLLENSQFACVLDDCIARLGTRKRTALTLRAFQELSTEEICKEMGVSSTNFWVLLHRGREALRRCLDKNWFEKT